MDELEPSRLEPRAEGESEWLLAIGAADVLEFVDSVWAWPDSVVLLFAVPTNLMVEEDFWWVGNDRRESKARESDASWALSLDSRGVVSLWCETIPVERLLPLVCCDSPSLTLIFD